MIKFNCESVTFQIISKFCHLLRYAYPKRVIVVIVIICNFVKKKPIYIFSNVGHLILTTAYSYFKFNVQLCLLGVSLL